MKYISIFATIIVLILKMPVAYGQPDWPPASETLFASGIELLQMELIPFPPPWVYPTATSQAASEPHCNYTPSIAFNSTDMWWIDYATQPDHSDSQNALPITLCHRITGEQRQIFLLSFVRKVVISPDTTYIVLITYEQIYSYNFATDDLQTLKAERTNWYDNETIIWHGGTTFFMYESNQGDMTFPWLKVSLGDVSESNSPLCQNG